MTNMINLIILAFFVTNLTWLYFYIRKLHDVDELLRERGVYEGETRLLKRLLRKN